MRTMRSPKTTSWFYDHNLVLMGAGLLLASSALDGIYMGNAMMPVGYAGFGLLLNLVSDVCTLGLSYWYRRLRMDRSSVKRKGAWVLLLTEVAATGYSWLFSWRQLLQVMPRVEGADAIWLAPLAAGFVPMLLFAIGYAEASRVGRLQTAKAAKVSEMKTQPTKPIAEIAETIVVPIAPVAESGNGSKPKCPYCDAAFDTVQGVSAHLRWCAIYQEQQELAHVQP